MPLNKTLLPDFKARPYYYFKVICSEIQGIIRLSGFHVCDHACRQSLSAPAPANGKLPTRLREAGPRSDQAGPPHQAICSGETHGTPIKVKHRARLSGRMSTAAHFRFNFPGSQTITAAVTSADLDCVFFLSLIKTLLVNDCRRSVLQSAASPKDSHKV